jgi:hypothetical protein
MVHEDQLEDSMEDRSFMVPKHAGANILPNTVSVLAEAASTKLNRIASLQPVAEIRWSYTGPHSDRRCTLETSENPY